jgi:hypothetical protein
VKDLDGQVLALLPENRPRLPLHDRTRAVMGIDDLIADFVQASPPLNLGAKRDAQDACGNAILPETRLVSELQAI